MKEVLYNYDYLKKEDITNEIGRVKVLLINSNDEVLLGHEHKTYQFIGGHIEENESPMECIVREVKEESGIELGEIDIKPFFVIKHYSKDCPSKDENTQYTINYYLIKTDEKFNLNNVEYTDHEADGDFELKYVPIDEIDKVLTDSIGLNKINKIIVTEMLEVIQEYRKNKEK